VRSGPLPAGWCENAAVGSTLLGRLTPAFALGGAAVGVGFLAGADPRLAIAAALGLLFVLIVLADLAVGLAAFTILAFGVQIPALQGPTTSVAKIAGLLLMISWIATIATRRDARRGFISDHPGLSYVLVLFIAWVALSQVWAADSGSALTAAGRLTLNAILVLIVYSAVRTPEQAILVIAAFVAGACLDAIYGLLFGSPLPGHLERLTSSISNPNELASILVAALVLSLGLAGALRSSPLGRLAALGATTLCGAAIFLTGSRGGLVGLSVALAAFLVVGTRWRGRILLATVLLGLAGFGYFEYVASPDIRAHVSSFGSGSGRLDIWTVAWRMIEANPLVGVGAGNFPVVSVHYLLQPGAIEHGAFFISTPKVTHNSYLEVWAELGIVGLALFVTILVFCVRSALRAARGLANGDVRMEFISRAVFVALVGMLATDFFGSREYVKELWLLLALGPALLAMAPSSRPGTRA
jgi:O-antigen ligase